MNPKSPRPSKTARPRKPATATPKRSPETPPLPRDDSGRCRAIITAVSPEIDAGRFPIKRVTGETVTVEADIVTDGHDIVMARLKHRAPGASSWEETPMNHVDNDRWRGSFQVTRVGEHCYTLEAWVDAFRTWRHDLEKKVEAAQDVSVELRSGASLVEAAAQRADGKAKAELMRWVRRLRGEGSMSSRAETALEKQLLANMDAAPDRSKLTRHVRELKVTVDPIRARFSAWYELFPRSCSSKPGKHGTFRDVQGQLPRLQRLGFDVLYLPPIHPIGEAFRKGKNNHPQAQRGEPGSPWGIGAAAGGHTAIHPQLGTLDDFRALVEEARDAYGIEVALDIALQCSPDHPWVKEHPDWFRKRADGSIQYAENPPKKYQDIYPLDFDSSDWRGLWEGQRAVFQYWADQGVRIFRVDNPHTKPFAFWEWLIADLKRRHPELIFLSEAFTRPKIMYRLAKLGFTQSYNYFPWRNTGKELTEYLTELTQTEVKEYFRPNLWPNTPDILPFALQTGGRPAFMTRLILASTLGASYGIYGPAFELCVSAPFQPGREEYLDSEKYEIKAWDMSDAGRMEELMGRLNRIRRDHPALQSNERLVFHKTDNPQLLAYSKSDGTGDDRILAVVNLDPKRVHKGWTQLDLEALGLAKDTPFKVHDLLSGDRYDWQGPRNYVDLNPNTRPAHLLHITHPARPDGNLVSAR